MQQLVEILKKQGITITAAESITGGLFAKRITDCAGASEVFQGSIVSYANNIKERYLQVPSLLIKEHGVVSEPVSQAMARGAQVLFESDIAISFTGNAGPDVLEDKPVGAVYSSILIEDQYYNYYDCLSGDREEIREEIVALSIKRLIKLLEEGEACLKKKKRC